MFRPQNLSSWERENRLLFNAAPQPMEAPDDPEFPRAPEGGTDGDDAGAERAPIAPRTAAERAIANYAQATEASSAERTRNAVVAHVEEERQKQLDALETDVDKRKKLGVLGTIATYTVGNRKTDEQVLSDSFDTIAKQAVATRNESLLSSRNKALHRIAESTTRTGREFIFLEQKCKQIQAYLAAYRKQLEVYQRERERFSSLVTSLRDGQNTVFASEIGQIEQMITRLEQLSTEEEAKASETTARGQVDEIRERDNNLRKLLIEENPDFFTKQDLSQLVLEAVSGNTKPLKDAIKAGVTDESKLDVFMAAVDELALEMPADTTAGAAYTYVRKWMKYRKDPEGRKKESERQQALAHHYSTQILDSEKSINAETIEGRLGALTNLPVGSKVAVQSADLTGSYQFTTAGTQKGSDTGMEFLILRAPNGGYAAINRSAKKITYQKDRFTKSQTFNLSVSDPTSRKDPTILYLKAA